MLDAPGGAGRCRPVRHCAAFLALTCYVWAEPCRERKEDAIIQFTQETCTCCFKLEPFIEENDYVFVLFYSMKGRLNLDVSANFEQVAEDWKWTKVNFARIDVDKDRDMASKWVAQGMVPTNVMFRYGRPVEVLPKDFENIRDRFGGSPEGQKYLLSKYMSLDGAGHNLYYVAPLTTKKARNRFIKFNGIAVVGFFKKEDKPHRVFHESVWEILQELDVDNVGAAIGVVTRAAVTPKRVKVPGIVVYVDGEAIDLDDDECSDMQWNTQAVTRCLREYLEPVGGGGQQEHAKQLEL